MLQNALGITLLLCACFSCAESNDVTFTDVFEVGPQGGVFRSLARGNPSEGVSLVLPEKAVDRPMKLSLGYSKAGVVVRSGIPSGVILVVKTEPEMTLQQPLRISVAFPPSSRYRGLVGFKVEREGRLRPIDLVNLDLKSGSATFTTFQSLHVTWVYIAQ